MAHIGFLYRLEWSNPYTQPPDGRPRILAEMFVPTTGSSRTPEELIAMHQLGSGYSITSRAVAPPPVERTPEQKVSTRRKLLATRMSQRYPLLAEEFVTAAIDEKPDYYLDGRSAHDESRTALIAQEQADIARYLAHANRLVVYEPTP